MLTARQQSLLRRLRPLRGQLRRDTLLALRAQILRGELEEATQGLERVERRRSSANDRQMTGK